MGLLLAKNVKDELIKETIKALSDENKLMEIITDDEYNFAIRELATKQITDNDLLRQIIFDTSDTVYTKENRYDIREIAVKHVTDEETLIEIVNGYYDKTVDTKYGLNVVEKAVEEINSEEVLLDIAESNYDEEVIDLAVKKINNKHENPDKVEFTDYNDDSKFKRLQAVDQIDDDEALLEIAMNADYLDVRQKALGKLKIKDDRIIILRNLIPEEIEYHEAINEYASSDEDKAEQEKELVDKANKLGVEYKRIGNPQKEKFYNQQCKLFKDNK